MKRIALTAVAVAVFLSLLGGLAYTVRRSIQWRTDARLALTTERERYLAQERDFLARQNAYSDSLASLRGAIADAKNRVQRASGQLNLLRDSLSQASQVEDSLEVALVIIEEQDTIITEQQDIITQYEISDAIMSTGLLIAEARSDSQNTRIANLEYLLKSAPLLQSEKKRKFLGVFPHPGDGWVILGTAVATLTLRSVLK